MTVNMKIIQYPKYPFYVQVQDMHTIPQHTREFLQEHAMRPLEEISVADTNDFLVRCWQRANWAGEAYNDGRQPE